MLIDSFSKTARGLATAHRKADEREYLPCTFRRKIKKTGLNIGTDTDNQ
jgi:hypothetical protein